MPTCHSLSLLAPSPIAYQKGGGAFIPDKSCEKVEKRATNLKLSDMIVSVRNRLTKYSLSAEEIPQD